MAAPHPLIRRRVPGEPERLPSALHPVVRRVYAARGVGASDASLDLRDLLAPEGLLGIDAAAARVADAIGRGERIVIAGDYDADGATGTAVAVLGLRALGACDVCYVVPDRFRMGYGLSPALAEAAAATGATLVITVDNGIASVAGVERARELGCDVVVTDHHLPGSTLPAAAAIVNSNQPGCAFASKALSGVGTVFYVLLAVRAELRRRGSFAGRAEPNVGELLDLVAVGTVADLVRLDRNNRILVEHGLRRIRAGRARAGVRALLHCAGRDERHIVAGDLGFALGPRINAAGRLDDMRAGIECLLADDADTAQTLARALDRLNRERRDIQEQMQIDALELVDGAGTIGLSLFHPAWHEGVVGLVASKVKELRHRPVIAFARAQQSGMLKGSGRSIAGVHLRDVLALVDAQHPGLIERFGGHAMAAGLSVAERDLPRFSEAFDAACAAQVDAAALQQVIETDGELAWSELAIDTAHALEAAGPWGQGFPEPLFEGRFEVEQARAVGADGAHVRYRLRYGDGRVTAMDFGGAARFCGHGIVQAVFAVTVNRYQGSESLDLRLQHVLALTV